jgi:phosphatidylserine/phosphatidylglycerophosphate/cardiolipin synthase-like enzyme
MPNITGKVIDDAGAGVPGVVCELVHFSLIGRTLMAFATTDAAGNYVITASPRDTMAPGQFHVKFKSAVNRLLKKTDLFSIFTSDVPLPTVTIPRNTLNGWLITNLSATGQQALLSQNNAITFLVDDAAAWKALANAIKNAQAEVNFQTLLHDIDNVFLVFNPDPPQEAPPKPAPPIPTKGLKLGQLLIDASTNPPTTTTVRYIIYDAITDITGVPYLDNADAVEDFFSNPSGEPNFVKVRRFKIHYSTPYHGKMLTADAQEAHLVGSPIIQKYFNDTDHKIREPRRGKASWFGIRVPIHEAGLKIVGPAVEHCRQTFFLGWNNTGQPDDPIPQMPPPTPSGSNVSLQIARTLPGKSRFKEVPDGETGVLEGYLRAFFEATDFVYMETQYLLSEDIVDGIRLALKRSTTLQFIIVLNYLPDIQFYPRTQNTRIRQLLDGVTKDGSASRLGIFTLWQHEAATPRDQIIGVYVHAKVGFADDKWATVGSANLDGMSMGRTDFFSTLDIPLIPTSIVRADDENDRAHEVNALILDGIAGQPAHGQVKVMRQQLWAEHLGFDNPNDPQLTTRPAGGWLSLWIAKATAKVAALNANPPQASEHARPIAWNKENDPIPYLKRAGVTNVEGRFDVLKSIASFDFATGRFE